MCSGLFLTESSSRDCECRHCACMAVHTHHGLSLHFPSPLVSSLSLGVLLRIFPFLSLHLPFPLCHTPNLLSLSVSFCLPSPRTHAGSKLRRKRIEEAPHDEEEGSSLLQSGFVLNVWCCLCFPFSLSYY